MNRRMMMRTVVLETKDLCKTFAMGEKPLKVLKKVNFTIDKGDFVSIMGPSGSGKSTLLYLLGGLDKATSGSVRVNGIDLSSLCDNRESLIRRKKLGFIFQFYNLIPNLNVEENILVPALLDGKKKRDCLERLDQLLHVVGLYDRRHHTPKELSGGQQQRVSIARALINDPEILLADEPTGNLDSQSSKNILELLKTINREKRKTIVMVTHSEELALYGNRLITLRDGQIIQ